MSPLVRGGEVNVAVEASAQRAIEIGYDAAIEELGFEATDLKRVAHGLAVDMLRAVPARATMHDVLEAVAAAHLVGLIGGIRLGKLYSGEPPQ